MLSVVRSRSCGRKLHPIWTLLAPSTSIYRPLPRIPDETLANSPFRRHRTRPAAAGHVRVAPPLPRVAPPLVCAAATERRNLAARSSMPHRHENVGVLLRRFEVIPTLFNLMVQFHYYWVQRPFFGFGDRGDTAGLVDSRVLDQSPWSR